MALYFYFNETTGDLVYSNQATYDVEGYVSLGEQSESDPGALAHWVFNSQRSAIVTVSKDESAVGKITGLTSMANMFSDCESLTSLDLSGFDTSSVTRMGNMFSDCRGLTSLDLSSFDTSSVTGTSTMFYRCSSLTSLDLSSFDTSSVTSMYRMFYGCNSLTSLDLSSFDTSAVTSMEHMFINCNSLTSLDLSSFDTSAVTNMDDMFYNCTSLRLITISDKMSNVLSTLPAAQYYPAAGGSPVAKASLTAGTWVRDEADLTKVTSIVQQAQMSQAISRRIDGVRRDLVSSNSSLARKIDDLASVNFGNLIPITANLISCWVGQYSSGGMPEPGIDFRYSVVSHDLHIVKQPYIGMKNDAEQPIVTIGLLGSVDVSTEYSSRCEFFTYTFSCNIISGTGGTIQKPVMVIGCDSSGSPIYFGYAVFNSVSSISLVRGTLWTTGENAAPTPSDITKLWFYS